MIIFRNCVTGLNWIMVLFGGIHMSYIFIDVEATGKHLKTLIQEKGISSEEIRNLLGLSCVQTIYKWYQGKTIPSIDNLVRLAEMLNVKIDDLIIVTSANK